MHGTEKSPSALPNMLSHTYSLWTRNTKMSRTKQEIEFYLFAVYRLKFKKVFFFEIDVAIATRWRHCYFYFSLICKKSRHLFLKLLIALVVHIIVFSCTDDQRFFMRVFSRNNWLKFLAPANKWIINNSFRVPQTDIYPDHGKKTLALNCF